MTLAVLGLELLERLREQSILLGHRHLIEARNLKGDGFESLTGLLSARARS